MKCGAEEMDSNAAAKRPLTTGPDELWGVVRTNLVPTALESVVHYGVETFEVVGSETDAIVRAKALSQYVYAWEPVLIGVSPAIRDALRAEVERLALQVEYEANVRVNLMGRAIKQDAEIASLKAELELRKHDADECCKAEKSVRKMLAAAMAELATLRGEGPTRVGDVVQVVEDITSSPVTLGDIGVVTDPCEDFIDGKWLIGHFARVGEGVMLRPNEVTRIGRAVRMPDGTPVDQ